MCNFDFNLAWLHLTEAICMPYVDLFVTKH